MSPGSYENCDLIVTVISLAVTEDKIADNTTIVTVFLLVPVSIRVSTSSNMNTGKTN